MTTFQTVPTESRWQQGIRGLTTGAKLLVVGLLALMMSLAALCVDSLVDERTNRRVAILKEISEQAGGQQTFLGPTLLVPYTVTTMVPQFPVKTSGKMKTPPSLPSVSRGVYAVFPARASAILDVKTQERRRSLFKVPVFQVDEDLKANFDLAGVPHDLPALAVLDWSKAEIVVGASEAHGALADGVLTTASGTMPMTPATTVPTLSYGTGDARKSLTLLGTSLQGTVPGAKFTVSAKLRFSGAQRIAILPYGKTTHLEVHGDWASPSFDGGLLPATREIGSTGFRASWDVPFIARGVRAEGDTERITGLESAILGVTFVEVADPYQSMTRSLKYAPLFLSLVFLTYFLFEVTTKKRLHIAQYLLVGVAQLIFYLLLLSFAERIGFDMGFLIAGGASVALLATNVGWIFASRLQALRAAGVFGALYGMIYMLLRLEDNALIVGALGSFAAVATAMYFTRSVDWYGTGTAPMHTAVAGGVPLDRVGEL